MKSANTTPKWWLIAKREFVVNVKKRSFLFTAFGIPLLMAALLFAVFAISFNAEEDVERLGSIGYVDQSGVLANEIAKPENYQAYENTESARAALEAGEIGAYFAVSADYLTNGNVSVVTRSEAPSALMDEFDTYLLNNIGRGVDPDLMERFRNPVESSLYIINSDRTIQQDGIVGLFLIPFVFIIVFLMGAQTTSGYLMSGVVEEKSNRIMEILVTTVTPFQLLFGKILGLGALGLLQLGFWVGVSLLVITLGQSLPFLSGAVLPLDFLIVALIYFILGYFLMASMMAGVGAVVSSEQESRQFAGIFSLFFTVPFFFIMNFLTDADGALVTFLCLFPFTAPISIMLRMAFASVSLPFLLLSMGILLVTTLAVIWISARVFRWALLMHGKRPSVRDIIRLLRNNSSSMGTTATATANADADSASVGK